MSCGKHGHQTNGCYIQYEYWDLLLIINRTDYFSKSLLSM